MPTGVSLILDSCAFLRANPQRYFVSSLWTMLSYRLLATVCARVLPVNDVIGKSPIKIKVSREKFLFLGKSKSLSWPTWLLPSVQQNHNNYIISLANLCRWLAEQAEALGVEIFPGMAFSELIYGKNGQVTGVVAGEFGKNSNGEPGPMYEPGMEVNGKYVFLAEGVRGSLSKEVISRYNLAEKSEFSKYGIGMKEVWEIRPEAHTEGQVLHTMGWPLGNSTGGGSFVYHAEKNQLYLGFVVHLNYKNPFIFPYKEFQKFKVYLIHYSYFLPPHVVLSAFRYDAELVVQES